MSCRVALISVLGWSVVAAAQSLGPVRFVEVPGAPARVPLGGDQLQPSAAPVAGGVFVVWADLRASTHFADVYGAWVDLAGRWTPSTGFPITTGVLGQSKPAVCCGDSQCLVAWTSTLNGVQVKRYGIDLQPLDLLPRGVSGGVQAGEVRCAAGPGDFLVTWSQWATGVIRSALIAADGTPGPARQVSGATGYHLEPDVAWNGLEYRVVWRRSNIGLMTAPVSVTGLPGTEVQLAAGDGQSPRIVAEGSDWATTWVLKPSANVYSGPLQGRRIASDGTQLPPFTLGSESAAFATGLARAPGSTLLAWHRQGGDQARYVAPWWLDGGLGAPVRVGPPSIDDAVTTPTLAAFDGGVLHLSVDRPTFTDLDLRAVVLDDVGQPLSSQSSTGLQPDWHLSPTIAASPDGGFDVAWVSPVSSADSGVTEIRVARLAGDGALVLPPRSIVSGAFRVETPLLIDGLDAPGLVWLRRGSLFTQDNPLSFAPLDATLSPGAPQRLDGPGCCLGNLHAVPMGTATWVLYVEYETSLSLHGVRVARDGSLLDARGRRLASGRAAHYASAFAPDAGTLLVVSAGDPSVMVQRFQADGTPIDLQERSLNLGSYPQRPAVASSGADFLLAWVDASDVVRAVPLSGATGTPSGPAIQLTSAMPTDATRLSLVFDGREYLLSFDAPSADAGEDVLLARFSAAGQLQDVVPLIDGPGEQHGYRLARSGPGRVGAVGTTLDPSAGVLRTSVRVRTALPPGAACLLDPECLAGPCVAGRCCDPLSMSCDPADGGALEPPDGGTEDGGTEDGGTEDGGTGDGGTEDGGTGDGGTEDGLTGDGGTGGGGPDAGTTPGPGSYLVGCGCASPGEAAGLAALALALRRRGRRHRAA